MYLNLSITDWWIPVKIPSFLNFVILALKNWKGQITKYFGEENSK